MHSAAATGPKRSRPSKVAPRSANRTGRAQLDHPADRRSPAASAAATRARCRDRRSGWSRRPAGPPRARAPAGRAHARVDHGQHDAGPAIRHGPHQRVAAGPHIEGVGCRWVRSMTVVPGARGQRSRHGPRRRTRPGSRNQRGRRRCERDRSAQGQALTRALNESRAGPFGGGGHRLHEGGTGRPAPRGRGYRPPSCRPAKSPRPAAPPGRARSP